MKSHISRSIIGVVTCVWVALVQPGLSYFWLIDPHVHAEIDADEFGQTPDGHTLPGHPWHPPHAHPTSSSLGTFELMQQNAFDAEFYNRVFSPGIRPSLQGHPPEVDVIAESIDVLPPDHPPRV